MLWVKSLHIIFMVTWFAGLFYLPRLFVYHALSIGAASGGEGAERFKVMERKLYYGIMTPGRDADDRASGCGCGCAGFPMRAAGCTPSWRWSSSSSAITSGAGSWCATSSTTATATATSGTAGSTSSRC